MIAGSTRLIGVIGDPVSHSRSPRMQNAALAALGLDVVYVPLRVDADRLDAALAGLVALSFVGANVTIPHKHAASRGCDTLGAAAQASGSVNTIVVGDDGTLHGDSTDGAALVGGIAAAAGDEALRGRALVLGAGGSARAACAALLGAGAAEVAVHARRPDAAHALAAALRDVGDVRPLAVPPRSLPEILVNCTPLGAAAALQETPVRADLLRDVHIVCDLSYRPDARQTVLCADAERAGCTVVDGLEVLVRQGALALELLCGLAAPLDVMRAAARGGA